MPSLPVIRVPVTVASASSKPRLVRDQILANTGSAVQHLFHLPLPFSFPRQGTPVNNDPIVNLTGGANGAVVLPSGGVAPSFAGGGLDFSPVTLQNTYLTIPPIFATNMAANSQFFSITIYMKLPALADWETISMNVAAPILSFATTGTYVNNPDLLWVSLRTFTGGAPGLFVARQKALNVIDFATPLLPATHLNTPIAVTIWRISGSSGVSIRSAGGGRLTTTLPDTGDNNQTITGLTGKLGVLGWGADMTVDWRPAMKEFRIYRADFAVPPLGTYDPLAVADADWARRVAEGAFS